MRLLILGGTTEASALARRIAERTNIDAVLSFAGRTRRPVPPPVPHRTGGFGGVEGLKRFLADEKIDAVMDATHPFAAAMSGNARAACGDLGLPLAVLTRPAWGAVAGDRWTRVAGMDAVVNALGRAPRRVFLTVGGLQLAGFAAAPWHHYVIRTIEPPDAAAMLPSHRLILARGPFRAEDEIGLMREERIDVLVSKNSGGAATVGKIAAARALGMEVVMVERPDDAGGPRFETTDEAMAWIDAHRPPSASGPP